MTSTSCFAPWQSDRRIVLLIILSIIVFAAGAPSRAQSPQKLNVLFIAVDDLNNALGCYGNPVVKTPHIDRLAKRGVVFERSYCQFPLCNPSRVSLLSGRRPDSTRVLNLLTPPRTYLPNAVFLPDHFKNNGYFTASVGKVFHETPSMKGSGNDSRAWNLSEKGGGKGRPKVAHSGVITGRGTRNFRWAELDVSDKDTTDGATAHRVAALLEERAKSGAPFFLAAGFYKPHLMWEAPKKYFDLYKLEDIQLPNEPEGHLAHVPEPAQGPRSAQPPPSESDWRQAIRSYYACISFVDAQVGVLLDQMDKLKLWDNTVVVFFSDHGYNLGEHGSQWEKMRLWEESIHAPLIVAAPGKTAGAKSPRVVELLDIYPTLVELCGLPDPGGLQGASLAPLLARPDAPWNRAAFTVLADAYAEQPDDASKAIRARSVRTERWHYVEYGQAGKDGAMLYDHLSDPREYRNLAQDARYAAIVAQMKQRLENEQKRISAFEGDTVKVR